MELSKAEREFLLRTIKAYERMSLSQSCSRDFAEEDFIDELVKKLKAEDA